MGYEERAPQPAIRQFGGLNTKDSELGLPGFDSPYMLNVDLHPHGSLRSRGGTLALSTPTGEDMINAVMRLNQPEDDRGWVYVIADGSIYRAPEPGTWTWEEPQYTGPSSLTMPSQHSYGRANARYYDESGSTEYPSVLYLPRSDGKPVILLGQVAAVGDIIDMPTGVLGDGSPGSGTKGYHPDWVAGNWPTKMRLVGAGRGSSMLAWGLHDNPNLLYYSELDVPYNFLQNDIDDAVGAQPLIDGGYAAIRQGDGDEIMSVVDMFGYWVIFKKRTTFVYTGHPGNDNTWSIVAEYPVGCVSDRAWAKIGNDIIFWAEDGPRILSAVEKYGDLEQSNLAFKINDDVRDVDPGSYERICCYHDITNMRVVFFVPSPAASHNDVGYIYYYNSGEWSKWNGPAVEMMDVEVIRTTSQQNDRIVGGSYENGVVQLQQGYTDADIDDDDDDIAADYYTNWINIGEISDASRVLLLDVMFGDDGANVDIYYQTDLNSAWTQITRIERAMGGGGKPWGKLTWGTDAWGTVGRAFNRYELDALFNLIRFRFAKTGSQGFEVMGYRMEIRKKGLRA